MRNDEGIRVKERPYDFHEKLEFFLFIQLRRHGNCAARLAEALRDIKSHLVNQAARKSENLAEVFMNELWFARILRERKPEVFSFVLSKIFSAIQCRGIINRNRFKVSDRKARRLDFRHTFFGNFPFALETRIMVVK